MNYDGVSKGNDQNKQVPLFSLCCFLKEIENMFSVFSQVNYGNMTVCSCSYSISSHSLVVPNHLKQHFAFFPLCLAFSLSVCAKRTQENKNSTSCHLTLNSAVEMPVDVIRPYISLQYNLVWIRLVSREVLVKGYWGSCKTLILKRLVRVASLL